MRDDVQMSEDYTRADGHGANSVKPTEHYSPNEERVYEARRRASEAETRLERERRKTRSKDERAQRRKARREAFSGLLTPKRLAGALISIGILVGFCTLALPGILRSGEGLTYLSTSELEKVVSISKLSTTEYVYNGIAEIKDDNGNVTQRIYYASTVRAGIDLTDVTFSIDNDNMTVTPIIPEIAIYDPSIDESSFDYIPRNPNLELKDIISICKKDARAEIESQGDIYRTARINLESAIQALTLPLLENGGYELVWPEDSPDSVDNDESNDEQSSEEATNEA